MKRGKKRERKPILPIIISAVVVVVLFGGFLVSGALLPKDTIAENVLVMGTDLGGMTKEEATKALGSKNFYDDKTLSIVAGENRATIVPADIGLVSDNNETVEKAFGIGKSKNIFKNSITFYKLLFSREDIGYKVKIDSEALDSFLYNFGVSVNGVFEDYQVIANDNSITIMPRKAGQSPDTSLAREQIIQSLEDGEWENIAITLVTEDAPKLTVKDLSGIANKEVADAEYVYENGEISIKEETIGIDVDGSALSEAVEKLNLGETVELSATVSKPNTTLEELKEKLFNATLASYSTKYSASAYNRASNVELASRRINGKILMPGEKFSYNETIGDTTIANGFKMAPVYANGKTEQGVGGGICQVSSTLYSAVLYADLQVDERRNHSMTVAYLPKGQDATVSYGAIDFKFSNNTEYPVKIVSKAGGGAVEVSLVGTAPEKEKKVTITNSVISSTAPTVKETPNPELKPDEKKVISTGKTGYVVDTYKTVYVDGVKISSKKITRSSYRMVPTEVEVGVSSEATDGPVVSPEPSESTEPTDTNEPMNPEETKEPEATQAISRPTPAPVVEDTEEEDSLNTEE